MPSVSRAQNRFMHAAAEGKVPGVSRKVGEDFVQADEGRKVGKLPEHVKAKKPEKPERDRRAERMAKRAAAHGSVRAAAKEFGTSKSTLHRHAMRSGYNRIGGA